MLIDTHCHLNMMVKKKFETPLTSSELSQTKTIIDEAKKNGVDKLITIGTSVIESKNSVKISQKYSSVYATVGIHPTDCKTEWHSDLQKIKKLIREKEHFKIVGIGECGIDLHYPDYDILCQRDAFRAQIDLALEHNLALVIHTRDAFEETWKILDQYKGEINRGVLHCFSEDLSFAQHFIDQGYVIGITGAITYPKNETLRDIVRVVPLENIILETDAPFLPPQHIRGKQNHPREIKTIAQKVAEVRNISFEEVAKQTTKNADRVFNF